MIKDFAGKTAFVTGAAGGLGLAMARAFGKAGMNVVMADIDEAGVSAAAEDLAREQIRTHPLVCDVAQRAAVTAAADAAEAAFGKVHVVCNNAGVAAGGPIGQVPPADWDWIIDVNLKSVVYGVETFAPRLLAHGEGGHIVNTASIAGMLSPPGMEPYSATKFAVVAMSEGWAGQLRPLGVGVSVLCPGFVKTRIHESRRVRQARYGEDASSQDSGLSQAAALAVTGGIEAGVVGERVLEAIRADEMYIFTHPNYRPLLQMRFAGILAGFDAADASEALRAVKEWPPIIVSPGGQ
jgi:NAD(P)-dependent dehydrogenase (short-subunit alcohol dehydrogenase family)